MGYGNDVEVGAEEPDESFNPTNLTQQEQIYQEQHTGEERIVKNLSLAYFRNKLVEHFHIAFERNEIVWPAHRNCCPQLTI